MMEHTARRREQAEANLITITWKALVA